MNRNARWIVAGAGAVLAGLFFVLSRGGALNERVGLFLALMGAAFVVYVAALLALRRGASRGLLIYVFVAAAACRVVLIPAEPAMSTDVYRYLWEGRMIAHGMNPFAHSPDAAELEFLRDDHYESINHKHLVTIYPPASQGVFALAALVRPDPQTLKLFFVMFDLGTILLLGAVLRQRSLNPAAAAVYAWNPLVIFETGHSGHVEPVGIFFLVLGLWLIARRREAWGFAAMGASFLAKYLSAIFVPYFLARKTYAAWIGVMAAVVVAGYLPFASAGDGLLSSLKAYSSDWSFNGVIHKLLYWVLGDPRWTRRLLALALGVIVLYQALKQKDVVRFGFVVVATGLLLAPTLYPWYVAWIVPFLCFYRNRAWLLFTCLVMASYWVWEIYAAEGKWELPWRLYALEYAPFYALLIFDAVRGRHRLREAVAG
jgi:alpha-1,6-mannosyltransferase